MFTLDYSTTKLKLQEIKTYDKAAIKCNGREAVTNLEPIIYGTDISLEAMDGGGHNLDRNLSVSFITISPKRNHDVQNLDMCFTTSELPYEKRQKHPKGCIPLRIVLLGVLQSGYGVDCELFLVLRNQGKPIEMLVHVKVHV
nr:AP2-like ethylene-responsive transcription factor [Tanacetum cinerariifolium]